MSEAYALLIFMTIIYMILCIEAVEKEKEEIADHPGNPVGSPGSRYSKGSTIGQSIVHAINSYGDKKHFAVPPFGCWFISCCTPHKMSARLLLRASFFVRQYVYLEFVLQIISMWAIMTMPSKHGRVIETVSKIILKVSGLTAVYGLFVLYKSTHDLLEHWNTTNKFLSIKFVIFLSLVQSFLIAFVMKRIRTKHQNTCLIDPLEPDSLEWVNGHYLAMFIAIESVLMVHFVIKAFPASEVVDADVRHLDLVEMELEHLHASGHDSGSETDTGSE